MIGQKGMGGAKPGRGTLTAEGVRFGRPSDPRTPRSVTLLAAGDGITLEVVAFLRNVREGFVGYAGPNIHHVRLCDYSERLLSDTEGSDGSPAFPLLADTHSLEVGHSYLMLRYHGFFGTTCNSLAAIEDHPL